MLAISAVLPMTAQRRQAASSFDDDYIFWGYPAIYLKYQAKIAYPLIDRMLQAYPPALEIDNNRQLALVTLDQFLHDAEYSKKDAFYSFVTDRMERVPSMMNEPMLSGVRVYKLYNSGIILKTLTTTVAIDLVPGGSSQKPFLTDSVVTEIVSRCNALLITNGDSKHANRNIVNAFVEAGKKVYLPTGLWKNMGETVQYVGADTIQTLEQDAMTLHILPGHNGNARNNIYVMDFHGRGIVAHTGTQDNEADLTWIEQVHNRYNIDILLTKSQSLHLESILAGFQPRMVIPAGENELENTVDRRESYWATQKRMTSLADLDVPYVMMTWGEACEYADTRSENISSSANKAMMNGTLYIERKGSVYTPTGIKVK